MTSEQLPDSRGAFLTYAFLRYVPTRGEHESALPRNVMRKMLPTELTRSDSMFQRLRERLVLVLVAAGLFTISWDRLANVGLGPYNVKLPSVLFLLAASVALPSARTRIAVLAPRFSGALGVAMVLLIIWFVSLSLFATDRSAAFGQLAAIASGCVAPAFALLIVLTSSDRLRWACSWLVAGGYFAACFGIYQLVAYYAGWPQLVDYFGRGIDGGVGRIAAFNYEPAYFTNFLIIVIGARLVIAAQTCRLPSWGEFILFGFVLVLANVRALIVAVPVFAVTLLIASWRAHWRVVMRGAIVALIAVFVCGPISVAAMQAKLQSAEPSPLAQVSTPPPSPLPSASAPMPVPVGSTSLGRTSTSEAGMGAIFDPSERSSNAPRLARYSMALELIEEHPVAGVGPGNLGVHLEPKANRGAQQSAVANNIWLQAALDGGAIAVLLEAIVVALLIAFLFLRRYSATRPLTAALITVLGVGGMLTSNFFDTKIWIGIAIVIAAGALISSQRAIRK